MSGCIFCRIVRGEIPASKVYEDEEILAFNDINPLRPVHVLVIPKKHVASLADSDGADDALLAACLRTCARVARMEGLANGFRVVSNSGDDACQSVHHLHFHVLGGRKMTDGMA